MKSPDPTLAPKGIYVLVRLHGVTIRNFKSDFNSAERPPVAGDMRRDLLRCDHGIFEENPVVTGRQLGRRRIVNRIPRVRVDCSKELYPIMPEAFILTGVRVLFMVVNKARERQASRQTGRRCAS